MRKIIKPRKKEGLVLFDLVVYDENTPILKVKETKLSALDEVLEMLNKKL